MAQENGPAEEGRWQESVKTGVPRMNPRGENGSVDGVYSDKLAAEAGDIRVWYGEREACSKRARELELKEALELGLRNVVVRKRSRRRRRRGVARSLFNQARRITGC